MGWGSLALCQSPRTLVSLAFHCLDPTTFSGSQHLCVPSSESKTFWLYSLFYSKGSGPLRRCPGAHGCKQSSHPLLSCFLRWWCSSTILNTANARRVAAAFALPGKAGNKPTCSEFLSAGHRHSCTSECWPQSGGRGTDPHTC